MEYTDTYSLSNYVYVYFSFFVIVCGTRDLNVILPNCDMLKYDLNTTIDLHLLREP